MTTHVVLHSTRGGSNDEFGATIRWFANPASQVSAHYVVDNERPAIARVVPVSNVAWHAGRAPALAGVGYNDRAVGIELCQAHDGDPFTDFQYWAVRMIRDMEIIPVFGAVTVVGHEDIDTRKSDPGSSWDWRRFRDRKYAA